MTDNTKITFSFGRNWQMFLQTITEERLKTARQSLVDFMGMESLAGKTFLDIGCGSGIFSYAAHQLGADRVVSFDVDPFSVACGEHMHERAGKPDNWRVLTGSVLDDAFVATLGQFDIVYSWGVLHHTGDMANAVRNAISRITPGGLFYIAIYNHRRGIGGSKTWVRLKKLYNALPPAGKRLMEWIYMGYYYQSKLIRLKNPWARIRQYQSKRGMNWRTDINDWLGGYPYEYADVQEMFDLVHRYDKDLLLKNLTSTRSLGTNQFLFKLDR